MNVTVVINQTMPALENTIGKRQQGCIGLGLRFLFSLSQQRSSRTANVYVEKVDVDSDLGSTQTLERAFMEFGEKYCVVSLSF